jgi:hypothetical protein
VCERADELAEGARRPYQERPNALWQFDASVNLLTPIDAN